LRIENDDNELCSEFNPPDFIMVDESLEGIKINSNLK
jgi:hypothetical protein